MIRQKLQFGIALPMVLLILLAITLPAVYLMRSTINNEKMTASSVDKTNALQAAEAGLVEAEAYALSKPIPPSSGCSGGICATPNGTASPWQSPSFWKSGGGYRVTNNPYGGISPKYVVEFLGVSTGFEQDCTTSGDVSPDAACNNEANLYRIIVSVTTATGAETMLQANYLVP